MSALSAASAQTSKAPAPKPQRRIIIYSDEEEEKPKQQKKPIKSSAPLVSLVSKKSKSDVSLVKLPAKQVVPFEKRMPSKFERGTHSGTIDIANS
jgi:hypothetical protein